MIPDVVAKSVAGGRAPGFSMFAWKAATRGEGVTPRAAFSVSSPYRLPRPRIPSMLRAGLP
jgi:hypothetical protein